jgi:hypothetical protein
MENFETNHKLIRMLLARLERISVDSHWAHRASGVRGSLIKLVEQLDAGTFIPPKEASKLTEMGFIILEQAALKKEGIIPSTRIQQDEQKQESLCFLVIYY